MGRYDEDYNDPRQYCQHGTFIGSWWGPDYLCGYCEDGVSRAQQVRWEVARSRGNLNRQRQTLIDVLVVLVNGTATGASQATREAASTLGRSLGDDWKAAQARHRALVTEAWAASRPATV